jgi:hypothetical protein
MEQVRRRAGFVAGRGSEGPGRAWFGLRPGLALAATLALGLVAGVLLTVVAGPVRIDEGSVAGTARLPGHRVELPVIDEVHFGEGALEAVARLRRSPQGVLAEVEIRGAGPADLTLEVDGETLRPTGFECAGAVPAGGGTLEPDRVEVRGARAGRCFVSLTVLGRKPGPVTVRAGQRGGPAEAGATLQLGPLAE